MKVLWLTQTSAGASNYIKQTTHEGGWIVSLSEVLKVSDNIELAICFFNNSINDFKFFYEGITYYPIKNKFATIISKIKSRTLLSLWDTNLSDLLKVVEDFKPEIIQLFGTESGLGDIIGNTKVPTIIHLQGLINPVISNWLPRGFSLNAILLNSSIRDLTLRRDLYSRFLLFRKKAKREEYILKNSKYIFGRTDWDRRIVSLFNKDIEYFHCDEVLRPAFYENQWKHKSYEVLKLVSTLNPQIYKGLDIVLETARLLTSKSNIKFEWNLIGLDDDNKIVKVVEKIKGIKFKNNSVYFKGIKQVNELIPILLESNLFIHPSHIDNSPNSVCEAMLMGMPVIAGNVGGIASLIETGHNGICYNSQDPYDLASIIIEKALDIKELERLGKNAHETALSRHNKTHIVTNIINTYKVILSKKNSYS
jgi:glycosyltransferase involved in cell wall biosynthesis